MKSALMLFAAAVVAAGAAGRDVWPDGSPIGEWFLDRTPADEAALGRKWRFDENGIAPGGGVATAEIQALIDRAAASGGGLVVVTPGVFTTGSLFFPKGVHLKLEAGAVLKGSDFIGDYPLVETRIEGRMRLFFAALVNADRADGFTLLGPGTIDGDGFKAWRSNRIRRTWNPKSTNLDGQRVRLLSVSRSAGVRIEGVTLRNPQFWTQHFWECRDVRVVGVTVRAPSCGEGWEATCTDGIDFDNVRNAVVRGCDIENWDDAVSLKGGGGPSAGDAALNPGNGPVENVLIEDCRFGVTHGALVLGSEAYRVRNVLMRRVEVEGAFRVLWLKLRADTPQTYEGIAVEDVRGEAEWVLYARKYADVPRDWIGGGLPADALFSSVRGVSMRRLRVDCREFVDVREAPDAFSLSGVSFEDCDIRGEETDAEEARRPWLSLSGVARSHRAWTRESHDDPPVGRLAPKPPPVGRLAPKPPQAPHGALRTTRPTNAEATR